MPKINHRRSNPTAKFLNRVNVPKTFRDRKNDYSRKAKWGNVYES